LRVASRGGFRIRLWDEEALLDAVLKVYDRMSDEFRRDLPLKRVWVPDWRDGRLETQATS
jgi:predicted Mrr-cat superfamily restriction endonuclease